MQPVYIYIIGFSAFALLFLFILLDRRKFLIKEKITYTTTFYHQQNKLDKKYAPSIKDNFCSKCLKEVIFSNNGTCPICGWIKFASDEAFKKRRRKYFLKKHVLTHNIGSVAYNKLAAKVRRREFRHFTPRFVKIYLFICLVFSISILIVPAYLVSLLPTLPDKIHTFMLFVFACPSLTFAFLFGRKYTKWYDIINKRFRLWHDKYRKPKYKYYEVCANCKVPMRHHQVPGIKTCWCCGKPIETIQILDKVSRYYD